MPVECLSPYDCDPDVGYLWQRMTWVQHADLYLLAFLLIYCVVVFLHGAWRCSAARRTHDVDTPRRNKFVSGLRAEARNLQSIASIAPYLGLAGTCFGLLKIFRGFAIAHAAVVVMMSTIGAAALFTSAAGIVVAIVATCFYNHLVPCIALLEAEVCTGAVRRRLPLQKRFSELPALPLIAAPALALVVLGFVSLGSFRVGKGEVVELARCDSGGDDRLIILRITNEGGLLLNHEPQNWDTLGERLGDIYNARKYRVLYLAADDEVPFQKVAAAIDIANNAAVGSSKLDIAVRLTTLRAMNADCLKPMPK